MFMVKGMSETSRRCWSGRRRQEEDAGIKTTRIQDTQREYTTSLLSLHNIERPFTCFASVQDMNLWDLSEIKYQGGLALSDSPCGTGGFCCIPGIHNTHNNLNVSHYKRGKQVFTSWSAYMPIGLRTKEGTSLRVSQWSRHLHPEHSSTFRMRSWYRKMCVKWQWSKEVPVFNACILISFSFRLCDLEFSVASCM